MTNVTDTWEPFNQWIAKIQSEEGRNSKSVKVADWTIDPGDPLFPEMAKVARMKCDKAGASYNCLIAIVGKVHAEERVWVGRAKDGEWVMRYTHRRRRLERPLTSDEIALVEDFDGEDKLPATPVRVNIDLADGSWRYAPKASQGAHDLNSDGVPQKRKGRNRTGQSTVPKDTRNRMRKAVQEKIHDRDKVLVAAVHADRLDKVRKAWRSV